MSSRDLSEPLAAKTEEEEPVPDQRDYPRNIMELAQTYQLLSEDEKEVFRAGESYDFDAVWNRSKKLNARVERKRLHGGAMGWDGEIERVSSADNLDLLNEQLGFGPSASGTLRFLYTKLHLGGKRGYGKYVMTFIIGVATGLSGVLVGWISSSLFSDAFMDIVNTHLRAGDVGKAVSIFVLGSICLTLISSSLVLWFAPGAAGSGVTYVISVLNGIVHKSDRLNSFAYLLVANISLCLAILSGLPIGREGPLIQIGASVASIVARFWANFERSIKEDNPIFGSGKGMMTMVSVGAAAGIAAAFRSPLGAVAFTFEVVVTHWSFETCKLCLLSAAISSLVINYVTAATYLNPDLEHGREDGVTDGAYVDLARLRLDSWAHASDIPITFRIWEMFFIIVLGAIGGLVGAGFVSLATKMQAIKRSLGSGPNSKAKHLFMVAVVTGICSLASVLLPLFFECRPLFEREAAVFEGNPLTPTHTDAHPIHWQTYTCLVGPQGGTVNEMATLTLANKFSVVEALFADPGRMYLSEWTLLWFTLTFYALSILVIGSKIPYGIMLPNIIVGASLGRTVGVVIDTYFKTDTAVRFYALMGAAGVLAGTTRSTFSITIVLMEVVANSVMGAPILLCAMTAKLVGDALTPGYFERMANYRALPVLFHQLPKCFYEHTVEDVASEVLSHHYIATPSAETDSAPPHARQKTVVLNQREPAEFIQLLLDNTPFNGFPVVVDRVSNPTLRGLVRRDQLLQLLKADLALPAPLLDIGAVMELCPWFCEEGVPAYRLYPWFRQMGMRHCVVVKDQSQLVSGIITRKDMYESIRRWEEEAKMQEESNDRLANMY